jgi:transposase
MRHRPGKYDAGIKVLAVQYLREGNTIEQVRRILKSPVSACTISRWHALYRRTRSVIRHVGEYERLGRNTVLTDEDRDFMLELLDGNPALYLDEYRHAIYRRTGIWVHLATVGRDLKDRLNLTLKKARTVHPNQSPTKRARFLHAVGALTPDMLVFLGLYFFLFFSYLVSHFQ